MILKFIFLFIIFSLGSIESAEFYDIAGRRYYISYPHTANYYGALKYCHGEGTYLLDILSDSENIRVNYMLNTFKRTHNATASFWTSATDLGSEGSFYWASNGHPVHFANWSPNQPDNNFKRDRHLFENCVAIENSLQWNDVVCEDQLYFICRDTFDVPKFITNRCTKIVL